MSKFLSLNSKDFIKSLILTVLSAVITIIYTSLQAGSIDFDWKKIGVTAITTALAYILKNLATNSEGEFMVSEDK